MDAQALKIIEDLVLRANHKEQYGQLYVRGDYSPLGVVHTPCIEVSSLKAFCNFLLDNPQNLNLDRAIIVINKDMNVECFSAPNELDGKRSCIIRTVPYDMERFHFGHRYSKEAFTVALKAHFQTEDSEWQEIFRVINTIQLEDGVVLRDTGLSQQVTLKKGISAASIGIEDIKADYKLRPYRIFPECKQPVSPFFLRFNGSKEEGLSISLYETDGGLWRIEAAGIIADFINTAMEGCVFPIYS